MKATGGKGTGGRMNSISEAISITTAEQLFEAGDIVLPGFTLPVAEIFA